MPGCLDRWKSTNLCNHVRDHLSPWEAAEDCIRQGHCRVEMGARDTCGIYTQHDTETVSMSAQLKSVLLLSLPPAPIDALEITLGTPTQHNLSDDTISEHEQNEGSPELSERFSERASDP